MYIPNTFFVCPSKDVRRRQFRPVTDGRLDVIINNFPLLCFMKNLELFPAFNLQSSLYPLCIQITNYILIPIDNVPMISYGDMIRRITSTDKTGDNGNAMFT